MSLAPYTYRPVTPPEASAVDRLHNTTHSRSNSTSSQHCHGPSPGFEQSTLPTPNMSPVLRHHGPTLLPKIRHQDATVGLSSAGGPKRTHRRMLSTAQPSRSFTPYATTRPPVQRSVTEPPEALGLLSPVSTTSSSIFRPRAGSSLEPQLVAPSADEFKDSSSHSPAVSTSVVDWQSLDPYDYMSHQMTSYLAPVTRDMCASTQDTSLCVPAYQDMQPSIESHDFAFGVNYPWPTETHCRSRDSTITPPPALDLPPTGSLLTYLTEPTQPINLVRQLTISPGRGLHSYFWWDIRNVRPWESFSLDTIAAIPGLLPLLNFGVDTSGFPPGPPSSTTATPASESDLANISAKIYFPKVNAASQLSQGSNSLSLYRASTVDRSLDHPHFLANYRHDSDRTLSGLPRGRIVGLVRSFDRWNTGMRHESPARKVDYLHGLAHLQKCMRDHSCRYGFILTEIELVCVRAGCDDNGQPYFGYVEVSDAIPTNRAAPPAPFSDDVSNPERIEAPLTVTLALYYLLMLAKSSPLPGQPASFMDVGGPGALTRSRIWSGMDVVEGERGKDGKDKWLPEPQTGEKREAKRTRGWIWPKDPWHKREGNGAIKRMSKARQLP